MDSIRLLIFDLDGTLIDSSGDIIVSVQMLLQEMGLPILDGEQILSFVGRGPAHLLEQVLVACQAKDEVSFEPFMARFLYLYEQNTLKYTSLYPGVREGLEQLAQSSWEMAICTNKPEKIARQVLGGLGLDAFFLALLGGDSLPLCKPDPAPLRLLMELVEATPTQTLMIGDSTYDIIAGQMAGTWTCGVSYGFHSRDALLAKRPDAVIDDFPSLFTLFGEGQRLLFSF